MRQQGDLVKEIKASKEIAKEQSTPVETKVELVNELKQDDGTVDIAQEVADLFNKSHEK